MNRVINSFINTVKKIKSEIFGKISDSIFLHVEKIKSEIFGKISDLFFLYAEKIKSEIFVPFGHRTVLLYECFVKKSIRETGETVNQRSRK